MRYLKKEANKYQVPIIIVLLVVYFAFVIIPLVPISIPRILRYTLFLVLVMLPWIIEILYNNGIKRSYMLVFACEMLFSIMFYLGKWRYNNIPFYSYMMESYLFWIPLQMSISVELMQPDEKKTLRRILWLFILISTITTIYGNILFPEASRQLASTGDGSRFSRRNIGGYGFVYAGLLALPFAMHGINSCQKKTEKLCYVIEFASILVMLYFTQYATALLLGILMSLTIAILKMKNTMARFTIGAVFIYAYIGCRSYIGKWLLSVQLYFKSQDAVQLAERVRLLREAYLGNEFSGDLATRNSLYKQSIEAFINSPIWGSIFNGSKVGGHSELLDILGATGILGGGLFVVVFLFNVNRILKNRDKAIFVYWFTSSLFFLLLASINTAIFKEIGLVIFMLPVLQLQEVQYTDSVKEVPMSKYIKKYR